MDSPLIFFVQHFFNIIFYVGNPFLTWNIIYHNDKAQFFPKVENTKRVVTNFSISFMI